MRLSSGPSQAPLFSPRVFLYPFKGIGNGFRRGSSGAMGEGEACVASCQEGMFFPKRREKPVFRGRDGERVSDAELPWLGQASGPGVSHSRGGASEASGQGGAYGRSVYRCFPRTGRAARFWSLHRRRIPRTFRQGVGARHPYARACRSALRCFGLHDLP